MPSKKLFCFMMIFLVIVCAIIAWPETNNSASLVISDKASEHDNELIFIDSYDNRLYSFNKDTQSLSIMLDEICFSSFILGWPYLYYVNDSTNQLQRYHLNDQGMDILFQSSSQLSASMMLYHDDLFVTETTQNSSKIYRISLESSEVQPSIIYSGEQISDMMCISQDWLYFSGSLFTGGIYRTKIDGTNCEKLSDEICYGIYTQNDVIYYLLDEDGILNAFTNLPDKTRFELDSHPMAQIVGTTDESIYFVDYMDGNSYPSLYVLQNGIVAFVMDMKSPPIQEGFVFLNSGIVFTSYADMTGKAMQNSTFVKTIYVYYYNVATRETYKLMHHEL